MIRTYRDPFKFASPEDVLQDGLFGGNNNGNLMFSEAAVRALAVEGVDVTCHFLDDSPMRPEDVNEQFDHLVLPLANAFRASFRGRLESFTRFIEKLTIPVTVLGVGAQSDIEFRLEPLSGMDDTVTRFVRAVLDRSPSIGVRGQFTASYLHHLGFKDVEVIGCPSMFLNGPDLPTRQLDKPFDDSSLVAFNLTPKLDQAKRVAHDLVTRYPRLVYFPQNERELDLMLWGQEGVRTSPGQTQARLTDLAHPLFTSATAHVHINPLSWIDDLSQFDFALGTRIHGNVAACLAGTPAHLLAADSRTRELAEYFELPYTRLVDVPSPLDLNTLTAGADYMAVGRGHRSRFDRYTALMDAHGLDHIWQPDARSTWDRKLGGRPLPAPVKTGPDTPVDLVNRLGWLKRRQDSEIARVEQRFKRQGAQIRKLQRQLDERISPLEKGTRRRSVWPLRAER